MEFFMKKFKQNLSGFAIITMITLMLSISAKAQLNAGGCGLNAGIALPAGITQSTGMPNTSNLNITFTNTASANFIYVLSNSFQIQGGIGFLSTSYTVASGSAPPSQSIISITAGGKLYLSHHDVMPYLGLGFSYTNLPKVTISQGMDLTGSLITVLPCFGVESFINQAKTVSMYIQMGIGFNSTSLKTTVSGNSSTSGTSMFNFGGSAAGVNIYFD
jgi:hypothetical protein